jgi:hypothetical protein
MSVPSTDQQANARRWLRWMFVGRQSNKPPGKVDVTLTLLGFVVWCSITAFTWGRCPRS